MHLQLRTWLITAAAVGIAVVIGIGLADEKYFLTSVMVTVSLWIFAEWWGGPRPEGWMLALVFFGYLVGNRGFAQFSFSSRLPLLPAESALLVGVTAVLFRAGIRQVTFVRKDALNLAILIWMVMATARLPIDWQRDRFVALRDYATVYYASFFFLAQTLGAHAPTLNLLRGALTAAALVLPPLAIAFQRAPDFFIAASTFRGVPLIFHKSDLIATSLAASLFWLWTRWEETHRKIWLIPAACALAAIAPMPSPRAAMVATAGVTLLWVAARRRRILLLQLSVVLVAAASLPVLMLVKDDYRETPIYSAYEHAISIFDFQGQGVYQNRDSGDPGDNNRFRLVWWGAVTRETLETNPLFGLGFGYDLSARFLADYDWLTVEDFAARSPHSIIFTMLGRLGLTGLAAFLAIAVAMGTGTWRLLRRARTDDAALGALGWWSVSWVLFVSGCFGVVLEGPMGATVFWTALGLAHATSAGVLADPAPRLDPAEESPREAVAALPTAGGSA
jgi:hypothetical protein